MTERNLPVSEPEETSGVSASKEPSDSSVSDSSARETSRVSGSKENHQGVSGSKESSGVSLPMLTRAALLATIVGRGIAPAIPGLTVGIAPFITLSGRIAAFLSQLVAAGGVAAAIRLAGGALRLPKLDLGYRLIALPGSAIVIALVMAAWARPLAPELCRMMAFAAIAAALSGSLASLQTRDTRASGLVLGAAGLSGVAHLSARELMNRIAERTLVGSKHWVVAASALATVLDVVTLALALAYLGQGKARKIAITAALVLVPALALGMYAAHGSAPGASVLRVLAERALGQLSRAQTSALPRVLRFTVTSALLLAAGACVAKPGARGRASVVLSMSLLSLGAADMPLPALWLVVAALLSPKPVTPSATSATNESSRAGRASG
ncbi:MAG TPA: hypothetical protein VFK05_32610 [Polyangiaceae bacterium]|nr:hypothetical protein [Polyangiaceae bacterium]